MIFGKDRYFKRQSHQLFRSELRRIPTIDNRRNNVRRERRKAQEARDVARRKVLLAGNSMKGQALQQALLEVVSSSDDS